MIVRFRVRIRVGGSESVRSVACRRSAPGIYDTKFGNTAKIAEAIAPGASGRGSVSVLDTAEAAQPLTERPDLLIVGGPTVRMSARQAHVLTVSPSS